MLYEAYVILSQQHQSAYGIVSSQTPNMYNSLTTRIDNELEAIAVKYVQVVQQN